MSIDKLFSIYNCKIDFLESDNPKGIIKTESAVYANKVMVVCPKCGKATRIAHKVYEDGKKDRMCKKCGETF